MGFVSVLPSAILLLDRVAGLFQQLRRVMSAVFCFFPCSRSLLLHF